MSASHHWVTWGNHWFYIPRKYRYLAFDELGAWVFAGVPTYHTRIGWLLEDGAMLSLGVGIDPPEKGAWDTQLYRIDVDEEV